MTKILIIEDDKKIEKLLINNLEKWNYSAMGIDDYSKVLERYLEIEPHLILLDINLPLFDGYYWCSKIREYSKVPIIFISSKESDMDIIMAMNLGADDYVKKPFSMEILMAKINSLMRRTYTYSVGEVTVIKYNDMNLSIKDNTLEFNNKKIELTKNEFKIMEIFIKNAQAIVSREEIMRVLWNHESFIDDNTLTVNINRLRKKLSSIGLDEVIITKKVRGIC